MRACTKGGNSTRNPSKAVTEQRTIKPCHLRGSGARNESCSTELLQEVKLSLPRLHSRFHAVKLLAQVAE